MSAAGSDLGAVLASDVDAADVGQLRFSLLTSSSFFAVSAIGGRVTVTSPFINFEQATSHSLAVRVADSGGLTADGSIVITVRNVNDAPSLPDMAFTVPENALGQAIGRAVAVDEDAGQGFKYTLTRPTHVCWAARLTAAVGMSVPFAVPISLPAAGNNVTVFFRAQLPSGAGPGTYARIALRAGSASTSDRYEFTFGEQDGRAAVRRCSPSVCSSPIGGLVAVPVLSTRTMTSYWVSVDRATGAVALGWAASGDAAAPTFMALQAIDPAVAARTAPSLNVSSIGLSGAAVGTRFSSVCFAHPSASAGSRFSLDDSGALAASPSESLDFETQSLYGVEVKVTDQPAGNDLQPFYLPEWGVAIISVQDVNERPSWPTQICAGGRYVACLTVPENSLRGTRVGNVPAAVDPDIFAAQTLSYKLQLDNNLAGSAPIFTIDAVTGLVTVSQSGILDFEARSGASYALVATATDSGSPALSVDAGVFISVIDVCEPPSLADASLRINENAPRFTPVGAPVVGVDPDFNTTSWGVLNYTLLAGSGLETNIFAINSATGQLFVSNASIDFERQDLYRTVTGFVFAQWTAVALLLKPP